MSQLFGTFDNLSVDDKGRFSIPASLRGALTNEAENTFTIIRGTEGCLFAYPKDEWLVFWEKIKQLPPTADTTRYKNRILGSLKETRLDAQGRVTLTQKLKELGEIGNDIVIVGNSEKMDIWNVESWKLHQASLEETGPYDADFYRLMNETRRNGNGG
jgi:MraZ protein